MTCRTCKHLWVQPDKTGMHRPRKDKSYPCRAPLPDLTKLLPASVTTSFGWTGLPRPTHMTPDQGDGCPLHQNLNAD